MDEKKIKEQAKQVTIPKSIDVLLKKLLSQLPQMGKIYRRWERLAEKVDYDWWPSWVSSITTWKEWLGFWEARRDKFGDDSAIYEKMMAREQEMHSVVAIIASTLKKIASKLEAIGISSKIICYDGLFPLYEDFESVWSEWFLEASSFGSVPYVMSKLRERIKTELSKQKESKMDSIKTAVNSLLDNNRRSNYTEAIGDPLEAFKRAVISKFRENYTGAIKDASYEEAITEISRASTFAEVLNTMRNLGWDLLFALNILVQVITGEDLQL